MDKMKLYVQGTCPETPFCHDSRFLAALACSPMVLVGPAMDVPPDTFKLTPAVLACSPMVLVVLAPDASTPCRGDCRLRRLGVSRLDRWRVRRGSSARDCSA